MEMLDENLAKIESNNHSKLTLQAIIVPSIHLHLWLQARQIHPGKSSQPIQRKNKHRYHGPSDQTSILITQKKQIQEWQRSFDNSNQAFLFLAEKFDLWNA